MPISVAVAVNVRVLIKEAVQHLLWVEPSNEKTSRVALQCLSNATYEFNRGCDLAAIKCTDPEAAPADYYVDAFENMSSLLDSQLDFAAHEEVALEILEAAEAIRDNVLRLPKRTS